MMQINIYVSFLYQEADDLGRFVIPFVIFESKSLWVTAYDGRVRTEHVSSEVCYTR